MKLFYNIDIIYEKRRKEEQARRRSKHPLVVAGDHSTVQTLYGFQNKRGQTNLVVDNNNNNK